MMKSRNTRDISALLKFTSDVLIIKKKFQTSGLEVTEDYFRTLSAKEIIDVTENLLDNIVSVRPIHISPEALSKIIKEYDAKFYVPVSVLESAAQAVKSYQMLLNSLEHWETIANDLNNMIEKLKIHESHTAIDEGINLLLHVERSRKIIPRQSGQVNDTLFPLIHTLSNHDDKSDAEASDPAIKTGDLSSFYDQSNSEPNDPTINTGALFLISASVLNTTKDYRESIRGNNRFAIEHPGEYEKLTAYLDELHLALEELLEIVPVTTNSNFTGNSEEIKSWRIKFWNVIQTDTQKLTTPEAAAKIALPVSIIFGCGAIGFLVGGPIAGGVGLYAGKLITGEVKASAFADKLEKAIGAPEN